VGVLVGLLVGRRADMRTVATFHQSQHLQEQKLYNSLMLFLMSVGGSRHAIKTGLSMQANHCFVTL